MSIPIVRFVDQVCRKNHTIELQLGIAGSTGNTVVFISVLVQPRMERNAPPERTVLEQSTPLDDLPIPYGYTPTTAGLHEFTILAWDLSDPASYSQDGTLIGVY
jgi:hypothetical protein